MRVIYETTESCKECLFNKCGMCYKLSRPLRELCFEMDCPLPTLANVESFTRYITKEKSLKCHGNCKNWERWHYNEAINSDVGICQNSCVMTVFMADDGDVCEEYEELP